MAFSRHNGACNGEMQEVCTTARAAHKCWQEYLTLCKQVRRAMRADKEKWWDEKMTKLEEDMKHNR